MARKKKIPPFTLNAMTKGGAVGLFNFYKKNFGVELVIEPHELTDGTGRWCVVMSHPFPEDFA